MSVAFSSLLALPLPFFFAETSVSSEEILGPAAANFANLDGSCSSDVDVALPFLRWLSVEEE